MSFGVIPPHSNMNLELWGVDFLKIVNFCQFFVILLASSRGSVCHHVIVSSCHLGLYPSLQWEFRIVEVSEGGWEIRRPHQFYCPVDTVSCCVCGTIDNYCVYEQDNTLSKHNRLF